MTFAKARQQAHSNQLVQSARPVGHRHSRSISRTPHEISHQPVPHQAGNSRCDQRTGRHLTAGQLGGGADRQFAALGRKHGRSTGDDQTSRTGRVLRGGAADDPSNCMKSHRFTTALDLAPSNRRRLPELRAPRRRTFTVPEVAQILGVGRSTAYALVRSGEIRALRFGARLVVTHAEVDRMLGEDPTA